MTENHDFNLPRKGTQDWHIPLNDNFKQIDTVLEVRDDEENIDQYEPTAGAKFLAIDTKRVFLGDGNQWTEFASFGSAGGSTSTVDILVTDHVGDDLGEQFNNAISAAGTLRNRRFVVPPSDNNYTISTPIVLDGNDFDGVQQNVQIEMRGALSTLEIDGYPAIEIVDVGGLEVDFGELVVPKGYTPSTAVVVGNANKSSGPEGKRLCGQIRGDFLETALYLNGRENIVLDGIRIRNNNSRGYVLAASSNDELSVNSASDLSSSSSLQSLKVLNGSKLFSVDRQGNGVVYLEGEIANTTFRDTEVASSGATFFTIDMENEPTVGLSFKDLRARMWINADSTNSAPGFVIDDGDTDRELRGISIQDIYFSNKTSDGQRNGPFFRVDGSVDISDLNVGGRTTIISNPDSFIIGSEEGSDNNLRGSKLSINNKRLIVGGDLKGTEIRGKLDSDYALSVSGQMKNVIHKSQKGDAIKVFGGRIQADMGASNEGYENLTSIEGDYNGQIRNHNGTADEMPAPRGAAQWDATLSNGRGNWRSLVDGSVFGPN